MKLLENMQHLTISSSRIADYNVTVFAPLSTSDHRCVEAVPTVRVRSSCEIFKPLYDLRKRHIEECVSLLSMIDWSPFYLSDANVNSKCDFFHELLSDIVKNCIPLKFVPMSQSDKPWMTPYVKFCIQARWDAYRMKNFSLYHHLKEKTKTAILSAKRAWSSRASESTRQLWKVANCYVGTKSTDYIFSLVNKFESVSAAVNEINRRFSEKNNEEPESQSNCKLHVNDPSNDKSWKIDISVDMVKRKLRTIKTKKSMGSDGIPLIIYKEAAEYLAGPITHLFNLSISECCFPNRWKMSHICPIPKSHPVSLENLRPISMLSIPSKILEKIVLRSVYQMFLCNIGNNQFGSRPSSSTSCAVIRLLHHALRTLESPNVSGVKIITYDYSKAFDTISHELVIQRLAEGKFPLAFIRWVKNYLSGRIQATRIGCTVSSTSKIVAGVPQGSVLGPMLFCLIVGSLRTVHASSQLIEYVDDITISVPLFKDGNDLQVKEEHFNILQWSKENGLKINQSKCKSICFTKTSIQADIQLDSVTTVDEIKFLGVILNSRLTWNSHISFVLRIASRRLYALRLLKPLLNKSELILIYYGTIRSLLEYASPSFVQLPHFLCESLEKFQRRCHRLICGFSYREHCACGSFPELKDRRALAAKKLFLSALNDEQHVLKDILPQRSIISNRFLQLNVN